MRAGKMFTCKHSMAVWHRVPMSKNRLLLKPQNLCSILHSELANIQTCRRIKADVNVKWGCFSLFHLSYSKIHTHTHTQHTTQGLFHTSSSSVDRMPPTGTYTLVRLMGTQQVPEGKAKMKTIENKWKTHFFFNLFSKHIICVPLCVWCEPVNR